MTTSDLSIGDVVNARVESVRGYGVIFAYVRHQIIVLVPDIPDLRGAPLEVVYPLGSEHRIKIVRRNLSTGQFVGKIDAG